MNDQFSNLRMGEFIVLPRVTAELVHVVMHEKDDRLYARTACDMRVDTVPKSKYGGVHDAVRSNKDYATCLKCAVWDGKDLYK